MIITPSQKESIQENVPFGNSSVRTTDTSVCPSTSVDMCIHMDTQGFRKRGMRLVCEQLKQHLHIKVIHRLLIYMYIFSVICKNVLDVRISILFKVTIVIVQIFNYFWKNLKLIFQYMKLLVMFLDLQYIFSLEQLLLGKILFTCSPLFPQVLRLFELIISIKYYLLKE